MTSCGLFSIVTQNNLRTSLQRSGGGCEKFVFSNRVEAVTETDGIECFWQHWIVWKGVSIATD